MSVNTIIDDTVGSGFTVATPDGPPRFSSPFDGDNSNYVLEEDYVISLASFASIALNTVHPVYSGYHLVKEGPLQNLGVYDLVKWTRTYAQVPASRNDYTTSTYKYPGYQGNMGVLYYSQQTNSIVAAPGYIPGRPPFNQCVPLKIVNDYFMVGTGGSYSTADAIPINLAQKYYYSLGNLSLSGGTVTWTPTYTRGSASDIATGIPTENLTDLPSGTYYSSVVATSPSRAEWEALRTAGTYINTEDSSVSRWMGNIFCRVTKMVVAR